MHIHTIELILGLWIYLFIGALWVLFVCGEYDVPPHNRNWFSYFLIFIFWWVHMIVVYNDLRQNK